VDTVEGKYRPLVPYVDHDSAFCTRECREQIVAERRIFGSFDRQFSEEHAVFNTAAVAGYCRLLRDATAGVGGIPSVDGYFAYLEREDAQTIVKNIPDCNGDPDEVICTAPHMIAACIRDDQVGATVRAKCRIACGACDSTAVPTAKSAREFRANYDWWMRKNLNTQHYANMYRIYNREKLFAVGGFTGPVASLGPLRNERCAGARCTCVFPFVYQNVTYIDCLDDGINPRWCPTSLPNTGEFLETSDDWQECGHHLRRGRQLLNYKGSGVVHATNHTSADATVSIVDKYRPLFILPLLCVLCCVLGFGSDVEEEHLKVLAPEGE
jgi:hypothetical protein